MALSKVSDICKHCEYYDDCDNKRMELCGYIVQKEHVSESYSQPLTNSIIEDMAVKHDYKDINFLLFDRQNFCPLVEMK